MVWSRLVLVAAIWLVSNGLEVSLGVFDSERLCSVALAGNSGRLAAFPLRSGISLVAWWSVVLPLVTSSVTLTMLV